MIKKLINSKFKKDLFYSYFAQAITIIFGFFQIFLINRYFGVDVFGQLTIIISTAGIFSALLTARSSEAVTRFFKREELNKNYENAKFILLIGLSIDFITAIILVFLIYILSNYIAVTFLKNVDLSKEIIIYSFITFFIFIRGSFIGYLQSKEMFIKINKIKIIESFFKIAGLLTVVFIFKTYTLENIVYIFLISSILSFVYTFYIFMKAYMKEYYLIKLNMNKSILKEYWTFNLKTFISSSLKIGAANFDNLILSYYYNSEIVGIYQTIKKFLSPLTFIITPFSSLTLPKIVTYYENEEYLKMHEMIKEVTKKLFIINLLLLLILLLFLKPFLILQNIEMTNSIIISFFILGILYIIPLFTWWGRNFIIMYNPTIPIYTNLLLSINSIWIPIFLYKLNYFDGLVTISLGVLIAYISSWIFAPIIYLRFMKRKKVI